MAATAFREGALMTKVVVLAGSPRAGGNTEKLLASFMRGAEAAGGQAHKITVAELEIEGWTPEVECPDLGSPRIGDDYDRVSRELVAADVIAVVSPVYFRNVPAQLKALIDHSQCQWLRKYVDKEPLQASAGGHERRRGVFLSIGGSDREHFAGTIQTIRSFFDVYEIDYWGELLLSGIDAPEDVDKEALALQEAYDLGFRAVAEDWT
jgi:multimeric flavodoxin WrbA